MNLKPHQRRLAGYLRRLADALSPPPAPVILPAGPDVPADPVARERLYERIAYTALAWMGSANLEARAAAASIIKRTYPGIDKQVLVAHADAMAFQSQLQDLLRAEEARAKQAEAAAGQEGAAC